MGAINRNSFRGRGFEPEEFGQASEYGYCVVLTEGPQKHSQGTEEGNGVGVAEDSQPGNAPLVARWMQAGVLFEGCERAIESGGHRASEQFASRVGAASLLM